MDENIGDHFSFENFIVSEMKTIKQLVRETNEKIDNSYVTKERFELEMRPIESRIGKVESIIYGLIALMVLGVLGALINSVIIR